MMFGVHAVDLEKAIQSLYKEFFTEDESNLTFLLQPQEAINNKQI